MPRRRPSRIPFNAVDRDNYRPEFELELVEDVLEELGDRDGPVDVEPPLGVDAVARRPRRELPPLEPPPLSAIELVWRDRAEWLEPYVARSIEATGGFRPILERAFGCDSAGV